MRLTLLAIDKLRYAPWRAAADEYLKRIRRYGARPDEVEIKPPKGKRSDADRRALEAEALLSACPDGAVRVVLDERGRELDSVAFAQLIARYRDVGREMVFVIGGASGHDTSVRKAANHTVALSQMTLPHELARVVLYEQIYRAFSIIMGDPYHK